MLRALLGPGLLGGALLGGLAVGLGGPGLLRRGALVDTRVLRALLGAGLLGGAELTFEACRGVDGLAVGHARDGLAGGGQNGPGLPEGAIGLEDLRPGSRRRKEGFPYHRTHGHADGGPQGMSHGLLDAIDGSDDAADVHQGPEDLLGQGRPGDAYPIGVQPQASVELPTPCGTEPDDVVAIEEERLGSGPGREEHVQVRVPRPAFAAVPMDDVHPVRGPEVGCRAERGSERGTQTNFRGVPGQGEQDPHRIVVAGHVGAEVDGACSPARIR